MMEYVPLRSMVHNLHPLTKIAWAAMILTTSMCFTDPRYLIVVLVSVIAVAIVGRVVQQLLAYLGTIFAVSIVVFVLQIAFRPSGRLLFSIFPASWPFVGGWFPVTVGGVDYGVSMAVRMICLVSPFPVLLTTTQPRDIAISLVERLRVPYDYAFMFTTALRFMPIILSEVRTISEAQRSRAYATEGWNPIRKIRAMAPIALPIVFIAIQKADRLGLCMELRGYGSRHRSSVLTLRLRVIDWATLSALTIATAFVIVAFIKGYGQLDLIPK